MSRSVLFGLVPMMIVFAIMVVEMATDLYAPVMPNMMYYFSVPKYMVQWTIASDLLGIAMAGILFGPLSDSYGRRRIILLGMGVFVIAAIACALAPTLEFLIAIRFLQGLGSGTVIVVSIAAIKDKYDVNQMSRIVAFIGMIIAVSPAVAPIIGGYIGTHIGWRGIFVVLTFAGAIVFSILYYYFPETLLSDQKQPFKPPQIIENYWATLKNKPFIAYTLLLSICTGIWWVEIANLPFLLIDLWEVPTQYYGFYFGTIIVFYIAGTIFTQITVERMGIDKLLLYGLLLKAISVICIAIFALTKQHAPWLLISCLYPGAFGMGLFFGNAFSKALSVVTEHIGIASAFLTLAQMVIAGIAITLVGSVPQGSANTLAVAEVTWLILTFILLLAAKRWETIVISGTVAVMPAKARGIDA